MKTVVVLGSLETMSKRYQNIAKLHGIRVRTYGAKGNGKEYALNTADAIIIFPKHLSHSSYHRALNDAKRKRIPCRFCNNSNQTIFEQELLQLA